MLTSKTSANWKTALSFLAPALLLALVASCTGSSGGAGGTSSTGTGGAGACECAAPMGLDCFCAKLKEIIGVDCAERTAAAPQTAGTVYDFADCHLRLYVPVMSPGGGMLSLLVDTSTSTLVGAEWDDDGSDFCDFTVKGGRAFSTSGTVAGCALSGCTATGANATACPP